MAGKYQLEAVIGEGGMGTVWAALHTGLGNRVALKVISPRYQASLAARRWFEVEARSTARIRSPHVVQVFDSGAFEDGAPYIAMELLRGESVGSRLRRSGPLAVEEAVRILVQCSDALDGAHAAGVVHRDVKPENLFLARYDDGSVLVKIVDFGIALLGTGGAARSAPSAESSCAPVASVASFGRCAGTPLYMSPEQAPRRGAQGGSTASIDHRSDLYSLGLVAFTLLTGTTARDPRLRARRDLSERALRELPLPRLRERAPWLPATLEPWFQRACAPDPSARFRSAGELAHALCDACQGSARAPCDQGPPRC